MIFYQGKGYLVYLIPICVFIICGLYLEKTNWWFYSCIITAGLELVVAYISYKEHRGNPYKYLDRKTGEELYIEHKNTVYWIKVEYWCIFISILLIISAMRS